MTLYIEHEPAEIGKTYTTFRGEPVKLLSIVPPHKPGSTGRVYVEYLDGGGTSEFFPSVIGGVWHGRTDQD